LAEPVPIVVLGAGGHAKVVIDVMHSAGQYRPAAILDKDPTPRFVLDVPVVGEEAALQRLLSEGLTHAIVALGDNRLRLSRGRQLERLGFTIVNAISPAATLAPRVRIGRGVAIMPGAVINTDTDIGDHVIINTRASVDHDCAIEEGVHIAPGVTLAGTVTVRRLAFIGVGTNVIDKVTIGEQVIVGAGACVIRDIPPRTKVVGVPARVIGSCS
jgi:UDP-perosamine 4-acetyltransferase